MLGKPRSGYHVMDSREHKNMQGILKGIGKFHVSYEEFHKLMTIWRDTGFREVYPDLDTCIICDNTHILEGVTFKDICNVFPAFAINIPVAYDLRHEDFGKITFLLVGFSEVNGFIGFFFEKRAPIIAILKTGDYPIKDSFGGMNWKADPRYSNKEDAPKHDFSKIMSFACNLILLMKMYPKYISKAPSKIIFNERKIKTTECHIKLGKVIPIDKTVVSYSKGKAYTSTGRVMPMHWRIGHWRRQFHGAEFDTTGLVTGAFDDGRKYHLKLIPPVLIHGSDNA